MMFDNSSFDRSVDRTALVLLILCSLAACFYYSIRAGASIAVGGALSVINFHWLKRAVDFVILEGATGPVGKRVAWQYIGRYALIAQHQTLKNAAELDFESAVALAQDARGRLPVGHAHRHTTRR